jgi:iron-sulfur cluster assembly protein
MGTAFDYLCEVIIRKTSMIHLTEEAARQMRVLADERGLGERGGLRLAVERGGCAGLQYEMSIAEGVESDLCFSEHGASLYVPPDSLPFLEGCTVDYEDGLSGAGFRVRNPRATRSCGCGTSFEPADAAADTAKPA